MTFMAHLNSLATMIVNRSLCAVLAILLAGTAHATTWSVPGDFPTIAAAIAGAADDDTINVAAGTYAENLILNKRLTLRGAQAGVNACVRDPNNETIITAAAGILLDLRTGSAGSVIDGFTFSGSSRQMESTTGPIDNIQILNNRFVAFTGAGVFLNNNGIDITAHQNLINGSNQVSGGAFHLDTDNFAGFHFTNNCVSNGRTGFFVDGNRNVGMSANRAPLFSGNVFTNNVTGTNLGSRAFADGAITGNIFRDSTFDGLQGGPKDATIWGNTFLNNGRAGLALTSFGNTNADRGAQNSSVTDNCFMLNGHLQLSIASGGVFFSNTQSAGTLLPMSLTTTTFSATSLGRFTQALKPSMP